MDNRKLVRYLSVFIVLFLFISVISNTLSFAKEEDVKMVQEGDRTRISVKTESYPEQTPEKKGLLKATAKGIGDVTYDSTKASMDAMGMTSDLAAKGFLTIGSVISGALSGVLGSKKEA